jgi:hypothetical protein
MNKNFVPFTDAEEKFIHKAVEQRVKAEGKYPLLFGLFITFGFVATLYGFEKLIDRVALFENHPWILLIIGVSTLLISGAAYKKLN